MAHSTCMLWVLITPHFVFGRFMHVNCMLLCIQVVKDVFHDNADHKHKHVCGFLVCMSKTAI